MKLVIQQKQKLNLRMTKELRQAIEILPLTTYELYQYIIKKAEENPFIELEENEAIPQSGNYYRASEGNDNPLNWIPNPEPSMDQLLYNQLRWLNVPDTEKEILKYLIFNIDENGFLTVTDEEVQEKFGLSATDYEKIIATLHQLEPLGIGARNLAECLAIQAQEIFPEEPLLVPLITRYLQHLADKKWTVIRDNLNISLEKIKSLFALIQTLDPRPGASLNTSNPEYVTPDITIDQDENDTTFSVTLNDYYIPSFNFNRNYSERMMSLNVANQYITEKYRQFQWLQRSIEQRRQTILKIMQTLMVRQRDFFIEGFSALQPLTLKEVADDIDMHESTVSRATANKTIQTPVGTFALRRLFSTKIAKDDGTNISQVQVKNFLSELIASENKRKPLSDQKIVDYLRAEKGIAVSRRTIAKYREEMRIPSSTKRKEVIF